MQRRNSETSSPTRCCGLAVILLFNKCLFPCLFSEFVGVGVYTCMWKTEINFGDVILGVTYLELFLNTFKNVLLSFCICVWHLCTCMLLCVTIHVSGGSKLMPNVFLSFFLLYLLRQDLFLKLEPINSG